VVRPWWRPFGSRWGRIGRCDLCLIRVVSLRHPLVQAVDCREAAGSSVVRPGAVPHGPLLFGRSCEATQRPGVSSGPLLANIMPKKIVTGQPRAVSALVGRSCAGAGGRWGHAGVRKALTTGLSERPVLLSSSVHAQDHRSWSVRKPCVLLYSFTPFVGLVSPARPPTSTASLSVTVGEPTSVQPGSSGVRETVPVTPSVRGGW
jgi:hypothetical protein